MNLKAFLLVILGLTLAPRIAEAQSLSKTDPLTSSAQERLINFIHFEGQGHMRLSDICQPLANEIKSDVRIYKYHLSRGRNFKAKRAASQVLEVLRDLESKNSECFDEVAKAYVLYSLRELQTGLNHLEYSLAVVLQWHDKIKLLTPSLRAQWGGIWNEKIGREYKVFGAYSCTESEIYIDPYMNPLNLGAVFVHELSHLMRDKYVEQIPASLTQNEWIAYDELMSSGHAAFLQRKLGADMTRGNQGEVINWKLGPYSARFDLNLFKRRGDVDRLFNEIDHYHDSIGFPGKRFTSYLSFSHQVYRGERDFSDHVESLWNKIVGVYFDREIENRSRFNQDREGVNHHNPLAYYQDRYPRITKLNSELPNFLFEFASKLSTPSTLCRSYAPIEGYMGFEMQRGASGEGVRPTSGEGVRPTLKHCLHFERQKL